MDNKLKSVDLQLKWVQLWPVGVNLGFLRVNNSYESHGLTWCLNTGSKSQKQKKN